MGVELQNKRVLVVGASGGIGGAAADAFAAAGAEVARPGRDALDLLDAATIAAFFERQAPFDHVVVAAARTKSGSVADLGAGRRRGRRGGARRAGRDGEGRRRSGTPLHGTRARLRRGQGSPRGAQRRRGVR